RRRILYCSLTPRSLACPPLAGSLRTAARRAPAYALRASRLRRGSFLPTPRLRGGQAEALRRLAARS
ncbi:MAG: hypothetical protein ACRD1X_16205, partial [Vicinamibacteria bacterium]